MAQIKITNNSIERIVIGLDASGSCKKALNSAVGLAAALGVEVEGIFVEDENLINFSALPFSTVQGPISGQQVKLDEAEIERRMRASAKQARELLTEAATENGVTWSFQVLRGLVVDTLLAQTQPGDILILGRSGMSARRRLRGGSLARSLACKASLVFIQHEKPRSPDAPVVVIALARNRAFPLLSIAAAVASAQKRPLLVLVPPSDKSDHFIKKGRNLLEDFALDKVHWLVTKSGGPKPLLTEAIQASKGGILAFDADNKLMNDERIGELVDTSGCSLLIHR